MASKVAVGRHPLLPDTEMSEAASILMVTAPSHGTGREEHPPQIGPAARVSASRREIGLGTGVGQVGAGRCAFRDHDVAMDQGRAFRHRADGHVVRPLHGACRHPGCPSGTGRRLPPASNGPCGPWTWDAYTERVPEPRILPRKRCRRGGLRRAALPHSHDLLVAAPVHRGRDAERFPVLGDGAAGDVDALGP